MESKVIITACDANDFQTRNELLESVGTMTIGDLRMGIIEENTRQSIGAWFNTHYHAGDLSAGEKYLQDRNPQLAEMANTTLRGLHPHILTQARAIPIIGGTISGATIADSLETQWRCFTNYSQLLFAMGLDIFDPSKKIETLVTWKEQGRNRAASVKLGTFPVVSQLALNTVIQGVYANEVVHNRQLMQGGMIGSTNSKFNSYDQDEQIGGNAYNYRNLFEL
jgi:hypothetical protein